MIRVHGQLCYVSAADALVYQGWHWLMGSSVHVGVAGQERKEVPLASHTEFTIEMTNLHRRVDVAVIDEI